MRNGTFSLAANVLELAAKGAYADDPVNRQIAEYGLLESLVSLGDDGGATDLATLILNEPDHPKHEEASRLFMWRVPFCPTSRALGTLLWLKEPTALDLIARPPDPIYYKALMYKARGLVEGGEYDDARELFGEVGPKLQSPPSFVAQCVHYLEERSADPVQRRCMCEVDPPNSEKGCECGSRTTPAATQASPCVCNASGTSCTRDEVVLDLDDGSPSTSKVPCDPEDNPP